MKDLTAVIFNFIYEYIGNTYFTVSLIAICALFLNGSLRKICMHNIDLTTEIEPEIEKIHAKFGTGNEKSRLKITEVLRNNNYIIFASVFLTGLQLVEAWVFMTAFNSTAIAPAFVSEEGLHLHKTIIDIWAEDSDLYIWATIILLAALALQRINDIFIENHLIGDQVLTDYIALIPIVLAFLFLPAYIGVFWGVTEIVELIYTAVHIRNKNKPKPDLSEAVKKSKRKKK